MTLDQRRVGEHPLELPGEIGRIAARERDRRVADHSARGRSRPAGTTPEPPHLTPAYAHLGYPAGSFPVAEELARTGLSLPIFPGMAQAQVEAVAARSRSTSGIPDAPVNDASFRLIDDVRFGEGVVVLSFANLYGCRIGDGTRIGPFVEVQRGAVGGARYKIQSHAFVCEGGGDPRPRSSSGTG